MWKKISSIISQNNRVHSVLRFIGYASMLLLTIYTALLSSGVQINFVYANF